MHRAHPAAERQILLVALALALGAGACIQPNEQSEGKFGTFVGNAVADNEADAGAFGSGGDAAGGNDNEGAPAGNANGTGDDNPAAAPEDAGTSAGGSEPGATTAGGSGGGGSSGEPPTSGDAGTGTTGADAGGDANGGTPTGVSSLTFSVLTKALGGQYSPRNIGAIWITNGSGAFVKTLELWASQRLQYLSTFQAQTNRNKVDAITSATLTSHKTHTVSWNLKDVNGNVVPDGKYNVVIETTDRNGFGDSIALPFTKSATPIQLSPPNVTHYVNMSLSIK